MTTRLWRLALATSLLPLLTLAVMAQPVIIQPDPPFQRVGGNGVNNLRVVAPKGAVNEVLLAMDFSYDGNRGPTATLVPVIEKRDQRGVSSWFGADPVTVGPGQGPIVVRVRFFHDEPGVPTSITTDRVRVLLVDSSGRNVITGSVFPKTITWGAPGAGAPATATAATPPPATDSRRETAEAARRQREKEEADRQEAAEARKRQETQRKQEAEQRRIEEARVRDEMSRVARELQEKEKAAQARAREDERKAMAKAREDARLAKEAEESRRAEQRRAAEERERQEREAQLQEEARKKSAAKAAELAQAQEEAKKRAEAETRKQEEVKRRAEERKLAEERRKVEEETRQREKARLAAEARAAELAKAEADARRKAEAEEARRLAAEKETRDLAQAAEAARQAEQRRAAELRERQQQQLQAAEELRRKAEAQARQEEADRAAAAAAATAAAEAAAKAKAKPEPVVVAVAPPPRTATPPTVSNPPANRGRLPSITLASNLKTKITNVDIVNRSLDRSQMTIGIEYEYKDDLGAKPVLGVEFQSSDDPEAQHYFTAQPVEIGKSRRNFVLLPVKFTPPSEKQERFPSFTTDRCLVYLADAASGTRQYLFPATMLLVWRPGGTAPTAGTPAPRGTPAAAAAAQPVTSDSLALDDLKQNDLHTGYLTVQYRLTKGPGKLRLRVYQAGKPETARWFQAADRPALPGSGLQMLELAVDPVAAPGGGTFTADTYEIELLDSTGRPVANLKKTIETIWARP